MSKLRASEAHLLELRKIHSMLHSAMDALIKDLNANEAARLLILLDDRLTSLINSADVESDADGAPSETAAKPMAARPSPIPPKENPPPPAPVTEPAAKVDQPSPSWRRPPPQAAAPAMAPAEPPAKQSDIGTAEAPGVIPSEPIIAVPPAPEPSPAKQASIPSFEEMIASAAKANLATPPPSEDEPLPTIDVAPEAPAAISTPMETPKADDEPPVDVELLPVLPEAGEDLSEARDEEPDWIEEDLEDGADLREEQAAAEAKPGLAGRLLSRFRLPGLGRRPAASMVEPEPFSEPNEPEEVLDDEEPEEANDEAPFQAPEPEPAVSPRIGRLHTAADQLAAGELLDEAARRTGNRIELRKVELGLDLVVKGLPKPLGTVRIAETDGHVIYHPGFGLDLPNREPNRADLEIWMKAMGDVVVRVLEDIGRRRMGSAKTDNGEAS